MAIITPPFSGPLAPVHRSGFELSGNGVSFAPFFYPNRVVVSKEQKLSRDGSPCGGEDVENIGSKNREIHVVGIIRDQERHAIEAVLDQKEPMDLFTEGWEGEVRVEDGEYEGPVGYDPHTNEWHWQYRLNLVSTGEDEEGGVTGSGIIRKADSELITGIGGQVV